MTSRGSGTIILIGLAVAAYFGYQNSPIPECLQIAATLDQMSDSGPFELRWGLTDKAKCVVASETQRQKWLSSAEILRFGTIQLQQSLSR
jgi:hypothetical protein